LQAGYERFGGICAILLGIGSLLYAIFFLVIGRQAGDFGKTGSWVILAVNGLLATAAYVALYERTSSAESGFPLWGLLLGYAQGVAMMANGVYQAVFGRQPTGDQLARGVPSWSDPKGLGTFLLFGVASFVFARVFLATGVLPRRLGYPGPGQRRPARDPLLRQRVRLRAGDPGGGRSDGRGGHAHLVDPDRPRADQALGLTNAGEASPSGWPGTPRPTQ
jgi:hypothetical protein